MTKCVIAREVRREKLRERQRAEMLAIPSIAARYYARLGWPVLPLYSGTPNGFCTCGKKDCSSPGKHPRSHPDDLPHGVHNATTDRDLITRWWKRKGWKQSNIGIATGKQSFDVLDVDIDDKVNGNETLAELESEYGKLPDTLEQRTGGGGRQILFQYSGRMRNSVGFAPGLDTRSDGGYIVVPPSLHKSGEHYRWKQGILNLSEPLAECSEWLLEKINVRRASKAKEKVDLSGALYGVPEGQRDDTLFRYACRLRAKRMSREEATVLVLEAVANCDPPFTEEEAIRKIESAWKYDNEQQQFQVPPVELWGDVWMALNGDEVGDARLLVHEFRGRYCFDHSISTWFEFNGNNWTPELVRDPLTMPDRLIELYGNEYDRVSNLTKKAAEKEDGEQENKYKKQTNMLLGRIKRLQKKIRRKNVVDLSTYGKNKLGITGTEWDLGAWDLAVANGVIDLKTGEIRSGKPEDYIKTVVPNKWQGLEARCYRWVRFLEEVFDDDQRLIDYVQRLLGMSLVGEVYEHVLPIFAGKGRNGKSTLLEVLKYVLGPVASAIKPEMLLEEWRTQSASAPNPDVLDLKGRRLVWGSETTAGKRFNTSRVKILTGGDTLVGRALYSNTIIQFQPTHTLILMTNYKPKADAVDYAFWKRVNVVPFELSFVDNPRAENERRADTKLAEKLKGEASGILAWLVQGCVDWQRRGMKLEPPDTVKVATEAYQCEADDILRFVEEKCVQGEDVKEMLKKIYPAYTEWCEEEKLKPLGKNTFAKRLEDMGFKADKDASGLKWFIALELNNDED